MIQNNLLRNVLLMSFLLLTGNIAWGQIFANAITGTNPNTDDPYVSGQTINANITVSGIGRGGGSQVAMLVIGIMQSDGVLPLIRMTIFILL